MTPDVSAHPSPSRNKWKAPRELSGAQLRLVLPQAYWLAAALSPAPGSGWASPPAGMDVQRQHWRGKVALEGVSGSPFIKQSKAINQKGIYGAHSSNNRFEWPVCLCDYSIFHANLNTREKGFPAQGPPHGRGD